MSTLTPSPDFIEKLKRLDLKAKTIVEGFLLGLHPSPYHGYSSEFREHREYAPFDDIKYIDWKLSARRENFYVKRFQEETNTKVYILFDISKSMDFGKPLTKIEYAKIIAASLSYLFFLQRDAPGLCLFSDTLHSYYPPRATRSHISVLFKALEEIKSKGKTEPKNIFRVLSERIKRRGVVILISDLLQDKENFITGIKYFYAKKHLCLVFQIITEEEEKMNYKGPLLFKDLEYQNEISVDTKERLMLYRKRFKDFINDIEDELVRNSIFFTRIYTKENPARALLSFLYKFKRNGI